MAYDDIFIDPTLSPQTRILQQGIRDAYRSAIANRTSVKGMYESFNLLDRHIAKVIARGDIDCEGWPVFE